MGNDDSESKVEAIEDKVLTELSMDCRQGIDAIAAKVGIGRYQVYELIKKLVKKYDIHFVPEIGLENVWKYEFLGQSWGKSKREILDSVTQNEVSPFGFEQYIAILDIKDGKEPTDDELISAAEGSYIPQYIARISGQGNIFMYFVARNTTEVSKFFYKYASNLSKFKIEFRLQFISPTFGYFPLNNLIIERMQVQPKYKNLLLNLNKDAKVRFTTLTNGLGKVTAMTVGTVYARLREIGLIKRPTLYMSDPKENILKVFYLSIINRAKFLKNRNNLFLNFLYKNFKHYVFMTDLHYPYGWMIITRFSNPLEADEFKKNLSKLDLGVEITESTILRTVYGKMGLRNFTPDETYQYKELESKGIVPHVKNKK